MTSREITKESTRFYVTLVTRKFEFHIFLVIYVRSLRVVGLATKWLRVLSLRGIGKIRNHLIAKLDGAISAPSTWN